MRSSARWFFALLSGCVTQMPDPTFTTPLGVNVFLFGQTLSPTDVDSTFQWVLEEFNDRYDTRNGRVAVSQAYVSFLPVDSYDLYGTQVAGNVSSDGQWIYVAAKTRPLSESAFAHEVVHYLDLQLLGDTDRSHASWAQRVYPGIERINQRMKLELQP